MISLSNIGVEFGGEALFEGVSLVINPRDRIGLVGKNGAGKTTLLRIVADQFSSYTGQCVVPDSCTIGYLEQDMEVHPEKSVFEEARKAYRETIRLQEAIATYEQELGRKEAYTSEAYNHLVRKHHDALERYQLVGGHKMDADIEKTLIGLGFTRADFQRPLAAFSKGWQMRIELAKILLQRPSLIMMDEPTNHLDIESIQWLETYLSDYPGAVVVVSHDRAFLDNITTRTVEITFGKIYDYQASYSQYTLLREERLESQKAAFTNQQREVRQIERFIERFRYKNTKASQVQSRIKMLDKLQEVNLDLIDHTAISFSFPPAPHAGKLILEATGLGKSYGDHEVLKELQFSLINGDRVAFVGRNGEGKTTLSKIVAGILDHAGELKLGHHVIRGYFAQNQEDYLDPGKTVYETMETIAVGEIRTKIRTILGGFLFSGEDMDKKVKVLSGGEKTRLALAKLLLTPANLLILDEPTNHLDMRSKDILKNALLQYTGTLIIVSHDRDFLQGLTNRVFEFRNRSFREYLGDIYDFLEQRQIRDLKNLEQAVTASPSGRPKPTASVNKQNYEARKEQERKERKIRNKIGQCESQIEQLEQALAQIEEQLKQPDVAEITSPDHALFTDYEHLKKRLDEAMALWERLHEELEAILPGE